MTYNSRRLWAGPINRGRPILSEILIIFLLVVLNGLFAMAEFAVVSSRKSKLQAEAEEGNRFARLALGLAEEPDDFLATIQVGITLIGIIAGVYGGATVGEELAALLASLGLSERVARPIGFGGVVILITYLSLVVGELVPKRLALNHPETLAKALAPALIVVARVVRPFVQILSASTDTLARFFPEQNAEATGVTEKELEMMIEQGADEGVFEELEERVLRKVLRLSDKPASAIMTPRNELVWFEGTTTVREAWERVCSTSFEMYPVCHGGVDNVVGIVRALDIARTVIQHPDQSVESVMESPLVLPATTSVLILLDRLRTARRSVALVVDEHGGFDGLVNLNDVIDALLGELDLTGGDEIVSREDGSLLVDAAVDVETLFEVLNVPHAQDEPISYHSLGGFVMQHLQRVPHVGDVFEFEGVRFEVVDMDGNRIDKVLVSSQDAPGAPLPEQTPLKDDRGASDDT